MNFVKLVINECIKIFKKKIVIIFFIISIISLLAAYGFMYVLSTPVQENDMNVFSNKMMNMYIDGWKQDLETADNNKKLDLQSKIEIYEFSLKNNIMLFSNESWYKTELIRTLELETLKLNKINKISGFEYEQQKNKINEIRKIIEESDFNGYIKYKNKEIEAKYKNKEITLIEYNKQIKRQEQVSKYEIGKRKLQGISWQYTLVERNFMIDDAIERGYDFQKNEYVDEKKLENLKDEKIINEYRLNNDIPSFEIFLNRDNTLKEHYETNIDSHYRFQYNSFAIIISMFVIALLFIILASSTISDEISKGTIKFLLVTPTKRYKIILAKILALIIILFIITFVIAQISTLLGNIFFNNASNEYLYVQDNVVKVMSTNIYETLQFLLKIPEIFIYILFAMTLSTLLKNKIISNTITLGIYIISNFMIFVTTITSDGIFDSLMKLNFVKYLPIMNFNLVDKILPIYKVYDGIIPMEFTNNSFGFSLIVIIVTAILLFITMLESFNKKDI